MNEELQQSLGELITLVKSGLSNLPPFLEKLSHELAMMKVVSGSLTMLMSMLVLILSIFVVNKIICRKEDLREGDAVIGITLGIIALISALAFVDSFQSVIQGLFAPTTVLIDYLQSFTK